MSWRNLALVILALVPSAGCTNLRTTDPARTATEQFLMSEAVNRAIDQLSAVALRDKEVFVSDEFVNRYEDRFLMAELRARLLMSGVRLKDRREQAKIILEVRSGGVGIDRQDYLLGIPAFALSNSGTGEIPLVTPEIAIIKNLKQRGFASVAFVAYWAETGELVASSGPFIGRTLREDYWLFGTGPRTVGNIPTTEKPR